MKRILILSANPKTTERLRLDEEVRDIKEALKRSQHRSEFDVRDEWAVRPRDMARAILEYKPNIIHFSGHGGGENGIVLEDEAGQAKLVTSEALSELFKLFTKHLECVIFNACYSEAQAKTIRQHINYVIGMNTGIKDRSAIEFAVGFYDALGSGEDYDFAYNLGCQYISIAGFQQAKAPQLLKKISLLSSVVNLGVNGSGERDYDGPLDKLLNWTKYYDFSAQPRKIASTEIWQKYLLPELEEVRDDLSEGRRNLTLNLRGVIPLGGAFAIGTVFQETRGFILQVEQSTGASNLWRSDSKPSELKFRVVEEHGHSGRNLCIGIAIARPSWPQVQQLCENPVYDINAVVYLEPDTEAGACDRALSSDSDAVALVDHAKNLVDHYRQHYRADRIHLVFACPMGFAALLGHRLRAIGDIIIYEFTKSAEEPYVPSVALSP